MSLNLSGIYWKRELERNAADRFAGVLDAEMKKSRVREIFS
jgi:hypothetical protein